MTMRQRIDVDLDELDQIIERSTHAPLSESDGRKLKTALHALAEGLARKRSTEKTKAVLPQNAPPVDEPDPGESALQGHGRNGATAFTGAHRIAVAHATLHSGDRCPACRQGKVYRQKEPATLVRFVGHAPLEATVFEMERLRCNACGEVFTAEAPETAGADKYDETAVAIVALFKVWDRSALPAVGKAPGTSGDAAAGGDAVGSDGGVVISSLLVRHACQSGGGDTIMPRP